MAWHSKRSNDEWGKTIRDQVIDAFEAKHGRPATAEEIQYATKQGQKAANEATRRDAQGLND